MVDARKPLTAGSKIAPQKTIYHSYFTSIELQNHFVRLTFSQILFENFYSLFLVLTQSRLL